MMAGPQSLLARLGWPGTVGILLAILALGAEVMVRQPMAQEAKLLSGGTSRSEHEGAAKSQSETRTSDLNRFYAHFRGDNDLNDWLVVVYTLAQRNSIELGAADYQLLPESALALHSYEMQLPLKGRYENIWLFAQSVLAAVPIAALDSIRLSRTALNATEVEAELKFKFYLPVQ